MDFSQVQFADLYRWAKGKVLSLAGGQAAGFAFRYLTGPFLVGSAMAGGGYVVYQEQALRIETVTQQLSATGAALEQQKQAFAKVEARAAALESNLAKTNLALTAVSTHLADIQARYNQAKAETSAAAGDLARIQADLKAGKFEVLKDDELCKKLSALGIVCDLSAVPSVP